MRTLTIPVGSLRLALALTFASFLTTGCNSLPESIENLFKDTFAGIPLGSGSSLDNKPAESVVAGGFRPEDVTAVGVVVDTPDQWRGSEGVKKVVETAVEMDLMRKGYKPVLASKNAAADSLLKTMQFQEILGSVEKRKELNNFINASHLLLVDISQLAGEREVERGYNNERIQYFHVRAEVSVALADVEKGEKLVISSKSGDARVKSDEDAIKVVKEVAKMVMAPFPSKSGSSPSESASGTKK